MSSDERKTPAARRSALADIHRMKSIIGLDREAWEDFLHPWGVRSSKDLSDADLADLRRRLHEITDKEAARQADYQRAKWSRKVYGVVAEWLAHAGYRHDSEAIRTVVCRAARAKDFNTIPIGKLRQIYMSWTSKMRTARDVESLLTAIDPALLN
ncbi:MAG: hypothetical protein ACI35Q_09535 [Marinilabiliaceae bacterium]